MNSWALAGSPQLENSDGLGVFHTWPFLREGACIYEVCVPCARQLLRDLISCSMTMKSVLFMEKHEFFKSRLGEFTENEEVESRKQYTADPWTTWVWTARDHLCVDFYSAVP